jgi:hypothetical protein
LYEDNKLYGKALGSMKDYNDSAEALEDMFYSAYNEDSSKFPDGHVYPFEKYVINYIKSLVYIADTANWFPPNGNALAQLRTSLEKMGAPADYIGKAVTAVSKLENSMDVLYELGVAFPGLDMVDGTPNRFDTDPVRDRVRNKSYLETRLQSGRVAPPANTPQFYLNLRNPLFVTGEPYVEGKHTKTVKWAKENGHDGVIWVGLKDGGPSATHYAVFDSANIKSPDNVGTFRPDEEVFSEQIQFGGLPDGYELNPVGPLAGAMRSADELARRKAKAADPAPADVAEVTQPAEPAPEPAPAAEPAPATPEPEAPPASDGDSTPQADAKPRRGWWQRTFGE